MNLSVNCNFSYGHYKETLEKIKETHDISTFGNTSDKDVILRHDVDASLEAALKMAELENKINVSSTYFILLSSEFYNPFTLESSKIIKKILKLGHKLGLHYNELFIIENRLEASQTLKKEIELLEQHFSTSIEAVAAHEPNLSQKLPITLPNGVIDAYSDKFFKERKYLSDSAQNWREGCFCGHFEKYDQMQILTHPMWWSDNGKHRDEIMESFVNDGYDKYAMDVKTATEKHALHFKNTNKVNKI